MARKRRRTKRYGSHRRRSYVRRGGAPIQALSLAGGVFGGFTAGSMIADRLPASWQANDWVRNLAPAAVGLAGMLLLKRFSRSMAMSFAAGGIVNTGVKLVNKFKSDSAPPDFVGPAIPGISGYSSALPDMLESEQFAGYSTFVPAH